MPNSPEKMELENEAINAQVEMKTPEDVGEKEEEIGSSATAQSHATRATGPTNCEPGGAGETQKIYIGPPMNPFKCVEWGGKQDILDFRQPPVLGFHVYRKGVEK